MKLTTVKNRIRKQANGWTDFANSASKWIKENPRLARGLITGLGGLALGGLGSKLLGSNNSLLWGLGLGAGLTGMDQYFLNNPDKIPNWLKGAYQGTLDRIKANAATAANKRADDLVAARTKFNQLTNPATNVFGYETDPKKRIMNALAAAEPKQGILFPRPRWE